MIDINKLREYANQHKLFMSQHASNRCEQRRITKEDIKNCILTGEIIEPSSFSGGKEWGSNKPVALFGYSVTIRKRVLYGQ